MKSTHALKIISIPSLLICVSVFLFNEFYISEVLQNFDSDLQNELGFLINLSVICGINTSILILYASSLNEESAQKMLKGVSLVFGFTSVSLFVIIFTTSIRIPYFILFMVLIFSIFAFTISRNKLE